MRPDIEVRNGRIYRLFVRGFRRKAIARMVPGMTYESVKKVIQLCERRVVERRASFRFGGDRRTDNPQAENEAREILSPFFPVKF